MVARDTLLYPAKNFLSTPSQRPNVIFSSLQGQESQDQKQDRRIAP